MTMRVRLLTTEGSSAYFTVRLGTFSLQLSSKVGLSESCAKWTTGKDTEEDGLLLWIQEGWRGQPEAKLQLTVITVTTGTTCNKCCFLQPFAATKGIGPTNNLLRMIFSYCTNSATPKSQWRMCSYNPSESQEWTTFGFLFFRIPNHSLEIIDRGSATKDLSLLSRREREMGEQLDRKVKRVIGVCCHNSLNGNLIDWQ